MNEIKTDWWKIIRDTIDDPECVIGVIDAVADYMENGKVPEFHGDERDAMWAIFSFIKREIDRDRKAEEWWEEKDEKAVYNMRNGIYVHDNKNAVYPEKGRDTVTAENK